MKEYIKPVEDASSDSISNSPNANISENELSNARPASADSKSENSIQLSKVALVKQQRWEIRKKMKEARKRMMMLKSLR